MEEKKINTENQDTINEAQVSTEENQNQEIQNNPETSEKSKRSNVFAKKEKKSQQLEELKAANEKLQSEKVELQDKFLRLYSEFDNYRKRTQKEKLDIIKNASENIITCLLPIIDDMERAIAFNENNEVDETSIKEGICLILQKLKTMLTQKGLAEIKTENELFCTDFHEAISTVPAQNEEEKGKILKEIQKGYTLNDKVIRYSKVIIYQ
jgi:molecular chaperone GrpE